MSSCNRRHGPTTSDLRSILSEQWTPPTNPYDEVYPGIFIGDATTAMSLKRLQKEGIGYILNGAWACTSCLLKQNCGGCVGTNSSFYTSVGITFIGIQANDERRFPIFRYFPETSDFIHSALNNGGKKIEIEKTATNIELLKSLGVRYIVNAAQGTNVIRYVNTSPEYYQQQDFHCQFFGVPAMDITAYQLHPFFRTATDFIQDALSNDKGKILVHCREGVSRSATLVIAYLMMNKDMTAVEAVKLVRSKRQIFPNDGFLEQLCDLDLRLRGERSYKGR